MDTSKYNEIELNADQVSWIDAALDRYAHQVRICKEHPGISLQSKAAKLAAMLEIMGVLNLVFKNDAAALNAISPFKELDIIVPRASTV